MNSVSVKMRKNILLSSFSFRSIHNLTPKSNHLSFEGFNSVSSSNMQSRGWSHAAAAAALPSEPPDTPKSRKRIPKHERRAMVESFVNKYRSENAGKFPNIKDTRKQVGGSYYTIREIVQELQYKSKMKASNSTDEISVEKLSDKSKLNAVEKLSNKSKLKTAESVNASSGNIETAKDRLIQDDSQLVILDDKETVNIGCEHLGEKRGPQTSSLEGRLSYEDEFIPTSDNHSITSESNILGKHFKEPYPSSLMSNDVKAEEAVSSHSDSVAPESQLIQKEIEHFPTPFNETSDAVYGKIKGDESEFDDIKNHPKIKEKRIEKVGHERKAQHALEDMSDQASHSSTEVPNDVKIVEAVSSCPSDYVTPERDLLKEKTEQVSATYIEESSSSCSKDQSPDKFVDTENQPINEIKGSKKAGVEIKGQDLPGAESPKHKKKQSRKSLELEKSTMDSSNKRETSSKVVSEKSTLWGNLKSFADGIIDMWRKL